MTTKNSSVIKLGKVILSRKDYDKVVGRDQPFAQHLLSTYHRSWHVGGVTLYSPSDNDLLKLVKTLCA